ncbi:MetQ/NlpA family ABC transporter substrate-binding protein [Ignatzschineria rhizosphaerae]|uniref:MetQ/NlpA family ABC transporter substrate-binding protein n=1 Tax=Ignatzschineria rhizosphaerae TaxID=2923279 RepID=A0ABY3WYN1_9GAMM|nr:MetQ/NlpA family ABC transporter substrate-binding protein [Ignatzschineria rhizosphaerae]UNM95727.1 MetQ/NlpA family ABC transporter substrate-binding protein [Ignatzschineria rhizosphaerae]
MIHSILKPLQQRLSPLTLIKLAIIVSTTAIFMACSDPEQTAKSSTNPPKKTLHISTSTGDFEDFVREYIGPELEKAGYNVTLTTASDTKLQNISVAEGSVDLNIVQHKPYLDEFNETHKTDLIPLVQVPTAPYGIYGGKHQTLDNIPQGVTIGIPSNVTNFARGLWILEQIGWIKLKETIPNRFRALASDIAENPYNIQIVEIAGPQMIRAKQDLDFAIINGNYVVDSDMSLSDALHIESSKHFVNWVVVNEPNKNAPWAKKVTEIINSDGFKTYIEKNFPHYDLPIAWAK